QFGRGLVVASPRPERQLERQASDAQLDVTVRRQVGVGPDHALVRHWRVSQRLNGRHYTGSPRVSMMLFNSIRSVRVRRTGSVWTNMPTPAVSCARTTVTRSSSSSNTSAHHL